MRRVIYWQFWFSLFFVIESFLISSKSKIEVSDMGSRFPEAVPDRQPFLTLCHLVVENFVDSPCHKLQGSFTPFLLLSPQSLRLCGAPNGRSLPLGRSWRFSCLGGHAVVVCTTFLIWIFGLCMRKNIKADTKNRPRIFPQSVKYLLVS